MSGIVEHLLTVPPVVALLVVGGLVFVEDALFVGFVIPGETAAVLGGVLAGRHEVSLAVMAAVVVVAAVVGDSVGYEVGRLVGPRVLAHRWLEPREAQIAGAQGFLARRGAPAVFLGRFTAFFRAMMPALAGTARMPYRRFLVWNALGGLVWGLGCVLIGYLAGNSYAQVEKAAGRGAAVAAAVVVVLALLAWHLHRRRTRDDIPAGS